MALRNNISQRYPRSARMQLVRWREIEGLPPAACRRQAAQLWPDLPAIHDRTWASWTTSEDYRSIRALVTGEQAERERMSDLLWAAGGDSALSDVATAASYALASRAMALAPDLDDVAEIRRLMSAALDARRIAAEQTKAEYESRIRALETEHAAETAELRATIADLQARFAKSAEQPGLRPETIDEIERRLHLL